MFASHRAVEAAGAGAEALSEEAVDDEALAAELGEDYDEGAVAELRWV